MMIKLQWLECDNPLRLDPLRLDPLQLRQHSYDMETPGEKQPTLSLTSPVAWLLRNSLTSIHEVLANSHPRMGFTVSCHTEQVQTGQVVNNGGRGRCWKRKQWAVSLPQSHGE